MELQEEGQAQDGHRAVPACSLMQERGWGARGNVGKGSRELVPTNDTGQPWVTIWDPPLQARDWVAPPAEAPAELQGCRGWWALSVLVHSWCWLSPGSALRVTGTSHGNLGEETPPSLGRERGQSRGLATASGAEHPGDITGTAPPAPRCLHHRPSCSRSAGSFLLKQRRPCRSLPGSSLGLSVPGNSTEKSFLP